MCRWNLSIRDRCRITEWVPIKPKTDAAFLYGVIHRIICERDWREVCDVPYLTEDTNSPYLIAPNGYYLRDPETKKPMILDLADNIAKPFDAKIKEPAMEGTYTLSGLEVGADDEEWRHQNVQVKPSFQLIDHMQKYTPEWASESAISHAQVRKIGDEFLSQACIGKPSRSMELPYRPVAVLLRKTVNNGWALQLLLGTLYFVWLELLVLARLAPTSNLIDRATTVLLRHPRS